MISLGKRITEVIPLLGINEVIDIGKYRCKATCTGARDNAWFLYVHGFPNDQIFRDLNIDKFKFCIKYNLKILRADGVFPYLSQEDLSKAVYLLKRMVNEKTANKENKEKGYEKIESEDDFPF